MQTGTTLCSELKTHAIEGSINVTTTTTTTTTTIIIIIITIIKEILSQF
jgi:hypothetical protein